jgi:transposase
MSECLNIDSVFRRRTMSKPYSLDLRERVVECVEGGASRHEAAQRFKVSVSSAIRWMQRFVRFRSAAAKPSGGSISPPDAHAPWLLKLIAEHPDLTLDAIVAAMHRHGIVGSRSAVWRFFDRHLDQYGAAARALRAGPAIDRPRAARILADRHIRRRTAP